MEVEVIESGGLERSQEQKRRRRLLLAFIIFGFICVGLMLSISAFEVYKGITKGSFGAGAIELIFYSGISSLMGLGLCVNALRKRVVESSWNQEKTDAGKMNTVMQVGILYFTASTIMLVMNYVFLESKLIEPDKVSAIKSQVARVLAEGVTYDSVKSSMLIVIHGMILLTILMNVNMALESSEPKKKYNRRKIDRVLLYTFSLTGAVLVITSVICGMYYSNTPKNWIDPDTCYAMITTSFLMVVTAIVLKIFSAKISYAEEKVVDVETNTVSNSSGNGMEGAGNSRSVDDVKDPHSEVEDSEIEIVQEDIDRTRDYQEI